MNTFTFLNIVRFRQQETQHTLFVGIVARNKQFSIFQSVKVAYPYLGYTVYWIQTHISYEDHTMQTDFLAVECRQRHRPPLVEWV